MKINALLGVLAVALSILITACGGGGSSATSTCLNGAANYPTCTLTWVVSTEYRPFGYKWSEADSFCRFLTFNNQTGWRLPTQQELTAYAKSGQIHYTNTYNPTNVEYVWASTPSQTQNYHLLVNLYDTTGAIYEAADSTGQSLRCVR